MKKILELKNVIKTFPGVVALNNVNFDLYQGEVHALLGENGAGKSTLIKIISGVYKPDSGDIFLDGEKINFSSPTEAIKKGIATIHQELNLFEELSVAENVFVGRVDKFIFSRSKMVKVVDELLKKLKFPIRANEKVKNLNTSEKQLVSIAKALSLNAKIIIMDEPTATITDHETKRLFEIIKDLKRKNISIIFISHRLEEVFEIADRVTVLRDGNYINSISIKEVSREDLIKMMVGRNIEEMYPKFNVITGKELFRIEKLQVKDYVENVTFNVNKGEIFGIAGLVGSGKLEIALGIYGYLRSNWDKLVLDGRTYLPGKDMLKHGIALVPEDRKKMGLVLDMDVVKNIVLPNVDEISKFGKISWKRARDMVASEVKKYSIKISSIKQKVKTLSGGNQQKVVLSKVLRKKPKIVFLVEPTRGIDVGAKVEVYNIINKLANDGVGVVFISSELPEIVSLCDRVLVMHRGRSMGILEKGEITQESILKLATGVDIK
ncbi:D-ribose transporter ATP-binding protein [Thermosipho sp. 1063]|uniref:sugar ABC transporter ATP-binding protein n=1 Tax=unclassified Thermosipho (in: thermotogales) TaxID=2676525 RepID=UPI000949380A|nr:MULTISPECIES: sugar ABC transporter ATP-binding protein [unclassified Thermosipho (in: thermotogales)]ANQ53560.1 D-ribose transporter ATP binding protein [Thermosipho sp. 1070]APT72008.1 D-ribose transporter ATP-binding protein [Thermosipho sp. 1063]OOC44389.1 D-ribose transporter ATP-binding protein [Thermosipho sp. 1074]